MAEDFDKKSTLNTTGYDGSGKNFGNKLLGNFSVDSILGLNRSESFFTEFYNSLLTTGNAPPINSHWLVFINDIPASTDANAKEPVHEIYKTKDNATSFTKTTYQGASKAGNRNKGILLAQGVKHTGDGTNYSREGYKNTGLWTGVLANGRSEVNTLDISFLESNVSFVDYSLRPWAVAVAHSGLTDSRLYANTITVWHLSKMGARTNMAKRKVFTYHNCFPISIDQQEYNYSGDDVNIKRAVSFGYHYYTVEDADPLVLDLLAVKESDKAIGKALDFFGLGNIGDQALDQIRSQFGANNVTQYLNNIVERGKSFARSVVSNTVQGAITNVGGAVQGAVDGAIRDVTSQGFAAGNNAVNSIANATNKAVNSITGSDPNSDTTNSVKINTGNDTNQAVQSASESASIERLGKKGYIAKTINEKDTPQSALPLGATEDEIDSNEVNINVPINQNDTPNNLTRDVFENDEGGITIIRDFAEGDPNADTPTFFQPNRELLYYVEKKIADGDPNADTPTLFQPNRELLYYVEKKINEDDTPRYPLGLQDSKSENAFIKGLESATNSNIDAVENAFSVEETINPNDANIGDDLLYYVEKGIGSDVQNELDPDKRTNLPQPTNSNDIPNNNVTTAITNAKDANINAVENAFEFNEEVNPNDSNINNSDLSTYSEKEIKTNDSNPSETIKFEPKQIAENDSNPSQSISYKQKKISENDTSNSSNITTKRKNISQKDSL